MYELKIYKLFINFKRLINKRKRITDKSKIYLKYIKSLNKINRILSF